MSISTRTMERVVKHEARVVTCDHCGRESVDESPSGFYLPVGWFSITTLDRLSQKRVDMCSVRCLLTWGALEATCEHS